MAVATGKEVGGKGTGDLLSEIRFRESAGYSNEEGQGGDAEDSTAPEPDKAERGMGKTETETAPRTRGERTQQGVSHNGQGRFGPVSHAQSRASRILHTHNGKCLRRHLGEQECNATKRAYVRFTEAWENGTMTIVECQERTPFDAMETSL